MRQGSTGLENRVSEPFDRRFGALPGFIFQNGYTLQASDLGNSGVKIELLHDYDTVGAIILPPKEVGKCSRWLFQTLGQDRFGLPGELPEILKRLSREERAGQILRRGDKTKIRDALKALNS